MHNEIAAELQQEELAIQKRKNLELAQQVTNLRELVARTEQIARAAEEDAAQLRTKLTAAEEALVTERTRAEQAEMEIKLLNEVKLRGEADKEAFERLREHVLEATRENVRKQSELRSALQNAQQMAQELALELKRSSEAHAAERIAREIEHRRESESLRQKLKALALRAAAESEQLHREHIEIVYALRQQFQEYQTTAERLFCAEAEAFEEQFKALVQRYDEQLGHVVRTKDFLFHAMAAAKDAKVMSLIDGTDFQKVLIRHQTELEVQRQAHLQDLANVRQRVEAEQRRLVYQLKKQSSLQQLELDRVAAQRAALESEIARLTSAVKQTRRIAAQRENMLEQALQEAQRRLRAAEDRCLALSREKELEKHRALRFKLQLEGRLDGSVAATAIRLQRESERLKQESDLLTIELKERSDQAAAATRMAQRAANAMAEMEAALRKKTSDYLALLKTFETFLLGTAASTKTSESQAEITNDALAETLRTLATHAANSSQATLRKAVEATLRAITVNQGSQVDQTSSGVPLTKTPRSSERIQQPSSPGPVIEGDFNMAQEILQLPAKRSLTPDSTANPAQGEATLPRVSTASKTSQSSEVTAAAAPASARSRPKPLDPIVGSAPPLLPPALPQTARLVPSESTVRLPPALRRVLAENAASDATHMVIAQLSRGYQKLSEFRKVGLEMATAVATGKPGSVADVILSSAPQVPYQNTERNPLSGNPQGARIRGAVRVPALRARAGHLFRSLHEQATDSSRATDSPLGTSNKTGVVGNKPLIDRPTEENTNLPLDPHVDELAKDTDAEAVEHVYSGNVSHNQPTNDSQKDATSAKGTDSFDVYYDVLGRHTNSELNPLSENVSANNLEPESSAPKESGALLNTDDQVLQELSQRMASSREALLRASRSWLNKDANSAPRSQTMQATLPSKERTKAQSIPSVKLEVAGNRVRPRAHTIIDFIDEEREALRAQVKAQREALARRGHQDDEHQTHVDAWVMREQRLQAERAAEEEDEISGNLDGHDTEIMPGDYQDHELHSDPFVNGSVESANHWADRALASHPDDGE